jgi:hypothetical protein
MKLRLMTVGDLPRNNRLSVKFGTKFHQLAVATVGIVRLQNKG